MKKILYLLLILPVLVKAQPTIFITSSADTICAGATVNFFTAVSGMASPHFRWEINGAHVGSDYANYTSDSIENGDTVTCQLTDSIGDTVLATSNSVIVIIPQPAIFILSSADTICAGTVVKFSAVTTWACSDHFLWKINGLQVGGDSAFFSSDSLRNGDTVICRLTDSAASPVLAASNGIIITVHPLPYAGTITGPDSNVCVNATLDLTDTVPGGIWRAENNYATVDSGVVTGVIGGGNQGPLSTDSIFYTVSNLWCKDSVAFLVNVIPLPEAGIPWQNYPFGEIPTLCAGQFYTLGDGDGLGPGINIYSLNGDAEYSNGEGGIYCVKTGNDVLTSVATNYCGTDTFVEDITIYGPPDSGTIFTSTINICIGDTIILEDTAFNGLPNYMATNYNALLYYNDTINYNKRFLTGASSGLDTIIFEVTNVCGFFNSTSIVINVASPAPIIVPDSLCKGYTISLTDSITGGTWGSNNTNIASVDSSMGVVSGIRAGVAVITYTLQSGCYDTASVVVNSCDPEVVIYPNPSDGELVIHAYMDLYSTCTLINSIGQKVLQQPLTGVFTNINIESLAGGVYFVKLNGDGQEYVGRFVKE